MRQIIKLSRSINKFSYLFDLIKNKKGFQKDIENIRKKWGVNLDDDEKLIEGDQKDLDLLLEKYGLKKDEWSYPVSMYIQAGKIPEVADPKSIDVSISLDKNFGLIKINPTTRKIELIQAWQYIKNKLPVNNTRNRTPQNHNEDIMIRELRIKEMSYEDIRKTMEENSLGADNVFNLNRRNNKIKKRINKAK